MIERYDVKEISKLWTDSNKFENFLKVEIALLEALENNNIIPKGIAQTIYDSAEINPERIIEIEKTTHHDVIAFCTSITEQFDDEVGKYFHYGVTSSDIIDTATSLQIKQCLDVLLEDVKDLLQVLKVKVEETSDIITLGRSHGMYAEPMSFAQKFLGHYAEIARAYDELMNFYENHLTCQISGTVGNYSIITPEIESEVATKLDLTVEDVSTQVIPRDRIIRLVQCTSLLMVAYERLAVEIRHLHRSDVAEVHEGFSKGQKGSSAMPHKKNPVSSENITGLSRIVRSHLEVAYQNSLLWHERDISHSSAERLYLPDNLGLTCYATRRLKNTVKNLVIHKGTIEDRVAQNHGYLSTYVLHQLIDQLPLTRETLYEIVQDAAFNGRDRHEFSEIIQRRVADHGHQVELKILDDLEDVKQVYLQQFENIKQRTFNKYE